MKTVKQLEKLNNWHLVCSPYSFSCSIVSGDASESRKLDKRLTFQVKDEEAKSRDGDPIESYKDAFTVWGSLFFLKGRKYFEAASANSEVQGETEIRFRADVNADMKIKYKNVMYDIISVIPTEKYTLSIMWKRGGMNG